MIRSLILFIALVATAAQAGFWTGNSWLKAIDGKDPAARGAAMGYIQGLTDTANGLEYCIPENDTVTLRQLLAVLKKGMTLHPEVLHLDMQAIATVVFMQAFPCEKKGTAASGV